MSFNQYIVVFYIFFWVVRINGCVRRDALAAAAWPGMVFQRSRAARFRTAPVVDSASLLDADVHSVRGRHPVATAIFLTGHLVLLNWLILGLCALIHINHSFSVDLAERQARPFAVPEAEQPVASMALSLKPRRLRNYANRKVEWALALSSLIALAWLVRYYFAAPEHHDLRLVFGVPVFLLSLRPACCS
jgi:hypothetical protein